METTAPTAEEAKARFDSHVTWMERLYAEAERRGTKAAWDAWRCAYDAQYDLWGVYAALAAAEVTNT